VITHVVHAHHIWVCVSVWLHVSGSLTGPLKLAQCWLQLQEMRMHSLVIDDGGSGHMRAYDSMYNALIESMVRRGRMPRTKVACLYRMILWVLLVLER